MLSKHPLLTIFAFLIFFSAGAYALSSSPQKISSKTLSRAVKSATTHVQISTTPSSVSPTVSPTPTLTPTPTTSEETVKYTDNGFSPKIVTISKGDKVIFLNDSSTDMWVASNYFPTSRLYPGTDAANCKTAPPGTMFDECDSVTNGGSWSFVFTHIGRWPYHNHLKPDDGGTIIVE